MPIIKSHQTGFAQATILLLAILGGGAVIAHEHAEGIVAERMQAMKDMASHIKALGEMLDGRVAFEDAVALDHALALRKNCRGVPVSFPRVRTTVIAELLLRFGTNLRSSVPRWITSNGSSANSSPRPCQDGENPSGHESVDVGSACKSCHEAFRLPEN